MKRSLHHFCAWTFLIFTIYLLSQQRALAVASSQHTAFLPIVGISYDSAEISASVPRGVYDTTITVALTSQVPNAQIRYTLNGSTPSQTSGIPYTSPITIDSTSILRAVAYVGGVPPASVGTWSYIFPDSVLTQSKLPSGFPDEWDDYPADYAMDSRIAEDPIYKDELAHTLANLPTLSVVTDVGNLFGSNGIYANPREGGREWERPTSIELIFPDATNNIQVDAGIRIHGNASRRPENSAKHSFRLYFRSEYGPTDLEMPLFAEQPFGHLATSEFDQLMVRAGYNNSWVHSDQQQNALYLRDNFARQTQLAMGQPGVQGRNVHLYLNGLYWGLYNLQERPDADFFASYFGGKDDDYDIWNGRSLADGDVTAWYEMYEFYAENNLSNPAAYAKALSYIDRDNLIDFIVLNHYLGNTDWEKHNWYAGRRRQAGERFIFINWDSENILDLEEPRESIIRETYRGHPTLLFDELRANSDFRIAVADRLYKHFRHDGALTASATIARANLIADSVRSPVVAESARWGDRSYKVYRRNTDWQRAFSQLQNEYLPQRSPFILSEYQGRGLYPSIEPPSFNQRGGNVPGGFVLQLRNPNGTTGTIWYTVDGSDPRQSGDVGEPVGVNGGDSADIALSTTTHIKSRIYNNDTGEWSALHEATFVVDATLNELVVSELMYHPLDNEDYEFIELKNTANGTLVLDGVFFSDGIEYKFPANTRLAPSEFYVLAKDPASFTARYGFAPDNADGYSGKFSNGGENIALSAANGQEFFSFEYDDEDGWPTAPDGDGYSLVLLDPTNSSLDLNNSANWHFSSAIHGSPGQNEP